MIRFALAIFTVTGMIALYAVTWSTNPTNPNAPINMKAQTVR